MAQSDSMGDVPFFKTAIFILCIVSFVFIWNWLSPYCPTGYVNESCISEYGECICEDKNLCDEKCQFFINQGLFLAMIGTLIVLLGISCVWISRYYMPHVTVNGVGGSIEGPPTKIKDTQGRIWQIHKLGASKYPIPLPGKLGTLVVPDDLMKKAGARYVGLVRASKLPFKKLPPSVFNYIYHHKDGIDGFNVKNVWFGKYTPADLRRITEVNLRRDEELHDLYSRYNSRQKLLEGDHEDIEELIETARRIGGFGGWNWPWKKKKQVKEDEE
jgi:hypothetical protein